MQQSGIDTAIKISINDATSLHLIDNKLMAYFLAKIYLFAKKIGLSDDKIRFRQHQQNEMAHYAIQCWDLECLVGGSWLECVGCADRGCYDLTSHSMINSKQPLNSKRKLAESKIVTNTTIKPIIPTISKEISYDSKLLSKIRTYFINLDYDSASILAEKINNNDSFECMIDNIPIQFKNTKNCFNIDKKEILQQYENFIPNVIEPSFGVDRLIYAVLDQNIWQRESDNKKSDNKRTVLSLPNKLNIYDAAVFPLHKKEEMINVANEIRSCLFKNKFKCWTDDSSTAIGKKYVRCDEIGVKYVVTVDPGTLKTGMVTIRNRYTMDQIIVHRDQVVDKLNNM